MENPASTLPALLAIATLLPLASFVVIVLAGGRMGPHGKYAGHMATAAIVSSFVLSLIALVGVWLPNHPLQAADHAAGSEHAAADDHAADDHAADEHAAVAHAANTHAAHGGGHHELPANPPPPYYTGNWYSLGEFGSLKLTIGWYIDSLTVTMFCMVTLIASCVHLYATGYMHDELHDHYTDHEVTLSDGSHLVRPGRFYRFFQYLSLFCFSMLGIVLAGNVAMVFVFWELVGICSYFLIGFYIERHSASTAANKAFIVNRVGDFGMLIGMMALWSSVGTFAFGDLQDAQGQVVLNEAGAPAEPGLFSRLRPAANDYQITPPAEMVAEEAHLHARSHGVALGASGVAGASDHSAESTHTAGQWLLLVAGIGIFCGCVGKSAQFPLHVWLPDAMEGPTPVSALVHSATMVAAGVYLVGRFYPCFSPEALLVIAYVGCITLFVAATIAITATDIKRVLAYSTVSQLGYMMLALGLGGWVAGLFHLITHAFFKGLLFLCSGSVIHAVHTNDMTHMGGLRKKMPITAYTMLIGCLAIIGAGIPAVGIGLSGYYSKDAIIEQAWSYRNSNPAHGILMFAPILGAAITAFYMFRLWYLTFAGTPRDQHRYDHAHESPQVMTAPLVILAVFAVGAGWSLGNFSVRGLLEQAQPVGTVASSQGVLLNSLTIPAEHFSHTEDIKLKAGWVAFATAAAGVLLATVIYLWRMLNPAEIKQSFQPIYKFLWHKWWFDELYAAVFVAPVLFIGRRIAAVDLGVIDWLLHAVAALARGVSQLVDAILDRTVVDGTANGLAKGTWDLGLTLRRVQTGQLRQYVLFIVVGTLLVVASALLISSQVIVSGGS
jgi:NADH-quinone oxidoreductase subunit L